MVSVPADAVPDVVREAAAASIPAAYVISEGFADAANDEGRARQARLVAVARKAVLSMPPGNADKTAAALSIRQRHHASRPCASTETVLTRLERHCCAPRRRATAAFTVYF